MSGFPDQGWRAPVQFALVFLLIPVSPVLILRGGMDCWMDAAINLPCRIWGHGRVAKRFTHAQVCADCLEYMDGQRIGPLPPAPREPLHTEGNPYR